MSHTEFGVAGAQAPGTSNLLDYWALVRRHRGLVFKLTLAVTLLVALMVYQVTPIYRGTAMLLIEHVKSRVMTLNDLYSSQRETQDVFNSQVQIISSRAVAERVARNLNLVEHPAMAPKNAGNPSPEQLMNAAVAMVQGGLSVEPLRMSRIVKISFDSPDRELAAKIANAVADAYIDNDLESRAEMTQKASGWLNLRMGEILTKLQASERALQQYREQENIVDNKGGVLSGSVKQLDEVSSNLIAARARLAEAKNAYNQVKDRKGQPLSTLESIPAVLKDSTVRQMKNIEAAAMRKVTEYRSRYAPAYPKMIAAEEELKSARTALGNAVEQVINGIYREYELARDNAVAAENAKEQIQSEIQNLSRKGGQLSVLQREVDSNRQLYDNLINRAKETEAAVNLQSAAGRVVDPAVTPSTPVRPKKLRTILGGMLFGVILSLFLVFVRDYLDNTLRTEQDVERRLHTSALGSAPLLEAGEGGDNPAAEFLHNPNSIFAESIRSIRTSVLLSAIDEPHRIVAVTSTVPGEGKTTIAISLAQALGQLKRVLIIDADLRRPSVWKNIGDGSEVAGLVDYLAGEAELADCIRGTANPNVFVLPAGKRLNSPLELLSSNKFGDTIETLKQMYDMVVIDCPPVRPVSDSLVISRYANAILYVIKADGSPYQLVAASLKSLREVDAHVLGVVLNQVNFSKADRYGQYSYQYRYTYGQDPVKPPRTFLGIRI